MAIDLTPKLTMRTTWSSTRNNTITDFYGDRTVVSSTVTNVPCYVYYDRFTSYDNGMQQTRDLGWTMILPNSLGHVDAGDIFTNVVDRNGNSVVSRAVVTDKIAYTHYRDGRAFVQVVLDVN